jgi:hypothetical protein
MSYIHQLSLNFVSSLSTTALTGMANAAQMAQIKEVASEIGIPLPAFLKNHTGARVSSLDELTYLQAVYIITLFS